MNEEENNEILTDEQDAYFINKIGEKIRDNWELWFDSWEQCDEWCIRHNL